MSVRYQPNSPRLLFHSSSSSSLPPTPPMAKQSQQDIDQLIQRAQPTNRDLVRRDIVQALQSPLSSLLLKVVPYYYNDGTSKDLLCLHGTVQCQYRGNRYNIPIEIWFQQDHPHVPPLAYVKPTQDMYVSTSSQDVQPDGTVVLPYLKKWRHPNSDLNSLLQAMSEAFSRSPPVYSGGASRSSQPPAGASMSTPYPSSTPYPLAGTSMPTPMGVASPSPSYPYGYPQTATNIPSNVYRDSLQTAVLDKIRDRLNDMTQFSRVQIDSLRKTEQDLNDGHFKIQSFIQNMQQQQTQAQNYLSNLQTKIGQLNEATQKMSMSSSSSSLPSKEQTIKDDAILTPAPVYKQLLQCYSEEHAIQDLLFYLADGLRRESIGLDIYLKHVRELSRRQFVLRATMQKCRQVAGLTSR